MNNREESKMTKTFSGEVLRERTIENADQMGTQAEAMAASIEDAAGRFTEATARLSALADELAKTIQIAKDSMATAKGQVEDLRRERDLCWRIRDTLKQQAAEGKPFEGTLVLTDGAR